MNFFIINFFTFKIYNYIMPTEEEKRDLERAEEYEHITARATVIGKNKIELSTGLIIAARYADKLRRVALVAFSRVAPKDVIVRDVAELNKKLYDIIVKEMKLNKLSVIRILVDAEYNERENKLEFDNIRVIRYLTEEECSNQLKQLNEKIKDLEKELQTYKEKIKKIEQLLSSS
ncbi:hypothetical protein ATY89_00420 [Sulfolobus acidocaldarius]|nr:hypothetical protein SacN8_05930 [Sulfolobus acidocaldarius N8]AGE73421.1 hypothetical protein SacRon12I_05925 [Sulfolobus acidocaldarius Ron12/I]ALU28578.1 hypothetical protein ATY89_00420 [Sulfolobus acidocaldarius]ALU31290.1 hypothetical protein ATZ20_03465 [Sulfolobus acidocaldarius]WCM35085.1 DUF2258 domain-containing protein [Sulfolobus acidocaldarius DSM 639]